MSQDTGQVRQGWDGTYGSVKNLRLHSHDLLLAMLEAYGFSLESLNLMNCYLTNRLQRVKANETYSSWQQVKSGVPQGSVLNTFMLE